MGLLTTTSHDSASVYVAGTFTGTGQSGSGTSGYGIGKSGGEGAQAPSGNLKPGQTIPAAFFREFNVLLWWTSSFNGTVQLERSFDGGATYQVVSEDNAGTLAVYSGAGATALSLNVIAFEPEYGVLYRWNCTAYSAGTANYRLSQ